MLEDKHLSMLAELIIHSWPSTKDEVCTDMQPYWSFHDEIAFIERIAIKGRRIIIPTSLKHKTIKQLHMHHMGREDKDASM